MLDDTVRMDIAILMVVSAAGAMLEADKDNAPSPDALHIMQKILQEYTEKYHIDDALWNEASRHLHEKIQALMT